MQWKSIEAPPTSDGFYIVEDDRTNREELSYNVQHDLWYDGIGKSVSVGDGYKWLDESAKPEIVAASLEFEVWDDRKGFPIYRSEDAFCNTYKVTSHYDGTFTYCAINKKQIDCASVDEGRVKCQEAANALIQKIAFLKY